jgi:mannose-6-phosphate isomerase class I
VVRPRVDPGARNGVVREELVAAPYFVVERFDLREPKSCSTADESGMRSVQILVGLEGRGSVQAHGSDPVTFGKGDAVVIPAAIWNFEVKPEPTLEYIMAHVPGKPLPEPKTTM